MGQYDLSGRKDGGLPSGFLVSRGHAFRDVQFLKEISQKVLRVVASGENIVSRNSRVKFLHPPAP
jgi:hypothetical protein